MNTRYLLGAVLACAIGGLYSTDGARAQSDKADAAAKPSASASAPVIRAPVAGQAVLGVTVAEQRLVAPGYRASKLLKQDVYNDKGEKIGTVDDLVIAPDGTLSIAVVNVGGFVGLGTHRVALPVRQFTQIAPKAVLPNAYKDQLKALPKFEYAA
jgi:sporulation protein YlmC with PRC-barrel domain